MKLPACTGYKFFTDCGYEFDCESIHEQSCEDCLCCYKTLDGLWHPETGKKIRPFIAFLLYGARYTDIPKEGEKDDVFFLGML